MLPCRVFFCRPLVPAARIAGACIPLAAHVRSGLGLAPPQSFRGGLAMQPQPRRTIRRCGLLAPREGSSIITASHLLHLVMSKDAPLRRKIIFFSLRKSRSSFLYKL